MTERYFASSFGKIKLPGDMPKYKADGLGYPVSNDRRAKRIREYLGRLERAQEALYVLGADMIEAPSYRDTEIQV